MNSTTKKTYVGQSCHSTRSVELCTIANVVRTRDGKNSANALTKFPENSSLPKLMTDNKLPIYAKARVERS